MSESMSVHRVEHPMHEQAWNEQQLARTVHRPILKVWTYDAPGLVLGCSQRALQTSGATVRSSGGGAVLTGPWMLSISVILPVGHPLVTPGLVESYRWFGLAHQAALQAMGVRALALPPDQLSLMPRQPELDWACFGNCSAWEVIAEGRKLVGLAQRRARTGVLLTSGTLVSTPDWGCLERYLPRHAQSLSALAARTTSCAREVGRSVPPEVLAQALLPVLIQKLFPSPVWTGNNEQLRV